MPEETEARSVAINAKLLGGELISPLEGTAKAVFTPPYLNYNIAADKEVIDKIVAATVAEGVERRKKWELSQTRHLGAGNPLDLRAHSGVAVRSEGEVGIGSETQALRPSVGAQGLRANSRVSGDTLATLPGSVTTPWWCPFSVEGTLSLDTNSGFFKVWSQTWWLVSGANQFFLGKDITNSYSATLDALTYFGNGRQLLPQSKSASFSIRTNLNTSKGNLEIFSAIVPISISNFAPCLHLQGASLYGEDDPCSLKGGDHGDRPTIEVTLDAPAGPDGQLVILSYDDPHSKSVVTWFNTSFMIPPFERSGKLGNFLGTRTVASEKTISVTATVNGQASLPLAIKVTKK